MGLIGKKGYQDCAWNRAPQTAAQGGAQSLHSRLQTFVECLDATADVGRSLFAIHALQVMGDHRIALPPREGGDSSIQLRGEGFRPIVTDCFGCGIHGMTPLLVEATGLFGAPDIGDDMATGHQQPRRQWPVVQAVCFLCQDQEHGLGRIVEIRMVGSKLSPRRLVDQGPKYLNQIGKGMMVTAAIPAEQSVWVSGRVRGVHD